MFSISFDRGSAHGEEFSLGTFVLGSKTEGFHASFDYWQPDDYEKQWREAIGLIVNGADRAALITEMPTPSEANFIRWWPMWRFGDCVKLNEQILFMKQLEPPFDFENPYVHVDNYQEYDDDGEHISVWDIPLQDFIDFLQKTS